MNVFGITFPNLQLEQVKLTGVEVPIRRDGPTGFPPAALTLVW